MDTSEVPMDVSDSRDKEELTMNPKENISSGQNMGLSGSGENMVQTEVTLVNVLDAIKDLALKVDNMDKTNTLNEGAIKDLVLRVDSIDKTNSSILVTLCRLVKAEATPTPKVVAENDSLHGTGSNSPVEQNLEENINGRTKVTSSRKYRKKK